MIAEGIRVAGRAGYLPRLSDWILWRARPSVVVISRRFGSWRRYVRCLARKTGLSQRPVRNPGHVPTFTRPTALRKAIGSVAGLESIPRQSEWTARGMSPCVTTIQKLWSGWREFVNELSRRTGLRPPPSRESLKPVLEDTLARAEVAVRKLGYVPSSGRWASMHAKPPPTTIRSLGYQVHDFLVIVARRARLPPPEQHVMEFTKKHALEMASKAVRTLGYVPHCREWKARALKPTDPVIYRLWSSYPAFFRDLRCATGLGFKACRPRAIEVRLEE